MNVEEFSIMMQELVGAEEERLQVGSDAFIRRDAEIMEMIDKAREGVKNGKSEKPKIGKVEI